MRSQIDNRKPQITIVGGGPAGSTLAIRLERKGLDVTLIEKDRFPREKLCGEFISPECFAHFESLGVGTELLAMGGDRIFETRFFSKRGRSVVVPTEWFGYGSFALSLSRALMDSALLSAAKTAGVRVLEGCRVVGTNIEAGRMVSLDVRSDEGKKFQIGGDIFVDASGRAAMLSKQKVQNMRPKLVAFKAHLTAVRSEPGVCEIYFFDRGYGGLSHIEDGKANFCFIVSAEKAREFIGNTNKLFRSIVAEHPRAGERLSHAEPFHEWLAVTVESFGPRKPPGQDNVVAVGDAGAFIDPFTGSGMLMAIQSSELLEHFIGPDGLRGDQYAAAHHRLFRRRLTISSVLRRAAFVPGIASAAIALSSLHDGARALLAKATRTGNDAA